MISQLNFSLGGLLRRIQVQKFIRNSSSNAKAAASNLAALHGAPGGGSPFLTMENINPGVRKMQFAVTGPLIIRAAELEKELKAGKSKPFKTIIRANMGDSQALGQKPITFLRQTIALVACPQLIDAVGNSVPEDVKARARTILESMIGHSAGAYTVSAGSPLIRKHIAEKIQSRDGGIPSNWEDCYMNDGASIGIKNVLKLFVSTSNKKAGIMIPIPQYPLYSASVVEFNMEPIGYYMDESKCWGLDIGELQKAVTEARAKCDPRVLVIINPGNPTGQVLTRQNMEEVIKFAHEEKLFLFADEVYQENIYADGVQFHSFKKVLCEMPEPYNKMELASFISASKGWAAECGLRGCYSEIINLEPKVREMYVKTLNAVMCPHTLGQVCIDCIVKPPKPGDPSYDLFMKEINDNHASLKERAKLVVDRFNRMEGFFCYPIQGALYAFPRIPMPAKAIEAAKAKDMPPDLFYLFEMLESTGIVLVPGSGFGQKPGTYHIRTTILPPKELMVEMLDMMEKFHKTFHQKYG